MTKFRGRSSMRQYLKMKAIKWGFEWWFTCAFVNKQTEGIILSNHSPWHVAVISGKVLHGG